MSFGRTARYPLSSIGSWTRPGLRKQPFRPASFSPMLGYNATAERGRMEPVTRIAQSAGRYTAGSDRRQRIAQRQGCPQIQGKDPRDRV
jgi:hypothetical protein